MYELMKKLISKKFYTEAGTVQDKLDVFFACDRLTAEQYQELVGLVEIHYA